MFDKLFKRIDNEKLEKVKESNLMKKLKNAMHGVCVYVCRSRPRKEYVCSLSLDSFELEFMIIRA